MEELEEVSSNLSSARVQLKMYFHENVCSNRDSAIIE